MKDKVNLRQITQLINQKATWFPPLPFLALNIFCCYGVLVVVVFICFSFSVFLYFLAPGG